MKKLFYSFAMLALLAGCSEDPKTDNGGEEPTPEVPADVVYTATLEAPEGYELAWVDGQAVSVFSTIANEKFAYNAAESNFKKVNTIKPAKVLDYIIGIHPYSSSTKVSAAGVIATEIPSQQTYTEGSYDTASNPMMAIAEQGSTALEFKNMCGFVTVPIYANNPIATVELRTSGDEGMAGSATASGLKPGDAPTFTFGSLASKGVTLNCPEEGLTISDSKDAPTIFTFIVAPGNYSKGFTVSVTDTYGTVFQKAYAGAEVKRNEVTAFEAVMPAVANNVIFDAQFNEDGTATDAGIYKLDIVRKTNDNGETPNMYTYKHPDYPHNNIVRFGNWGQNWIFTDSYYYVDYSANEAFTANLADGFTFELITQTQMFNWDWWKTSAGTDTWGFGQLGSAGQDVRFFAHNRSDWFPGTRHNLQAAPTRGTYDHHMVCYDADAKKVAIYFNGVLDSELNAELGAGNRLTIGGWAYGDLVRANCGYDGEIAMVRFYAMPMGQEDVTKRFAELTIPSTPKPTKVGVNDPIFDAQFNEDGTATNVGTVAMDIVTVPHETLKTRKIGDTTVAQITRQPNNARYTDGFYWIDYRTNEEFKSKLADGFTMEIVCGVPNYPGNFWTSVARSDKWGFVFLDGHRDYVTCINNADNNVYDHGWRHTGYVPGDTHSAHLIYRFDGSSVQLYVNGNYARENHGCADFNVGSIFVIGGFPILESADGTKTCEHNWWGDIATVRIYDEALNVFQINDLYNEAKPMMKQILDSYAQ